MKKFFILFLFVLTASCLTKAYAAQTNSYNESMSQMGFDISNIDFNNFYFETQPCNGTINYFYYNDIECGSSLIEFGYAQLKNPVQYKGVSPRHDYCVELVRCFRTMIYPRQITTKVKGFLGIKTNKTLKFGVSDVQFYTHYYNYDPGDGSKFLTRGIETHISSSGDDVKYTQSFGGSGTLTLGIGIQNSVTVSEDKSVADYYNKSNSSKLDVDFVFYSPKTRAQEQFIYEHSYFYVMDAILQNPSLDYNMFPLKYTFEISAGSSYKATISKSHELTPSNYKLRY